MNICKFLATLLFFANSLIVSEFTSASPYFSSQYMFEAQVYPYIGPSGSKEGVIVYYDVGSMPGTQLPASFAAVCAEQITTSGLGLSQLSPCTNVASANVARAWVHNASDFSPSPWLPGYWYYQIVPLNCTPGSSAAIQVLQPSSPQNFVVFEPNGGSPFRFPPAQAFFESDHPPESIQLYVRECELVELR